MRYRPHRNRVWAVAGMALAVMVQGSALAASSTPPAKVVPPQPPACTSNLSVTPPQTEGPFYKPNSPERTSLLEPGMVGARVIVTGYVLTVGCKPIARAWLDFWQANDKGEYDTAGYRLRGHQYADNSGVYYLETILPGLYPGRTRHVHAKVRAPNGPVLTTQLFFPGEPRNQSDVIFNSLLVVATQETAGANVATFNFVLGGR